MTIVIYVKEVEKLFAAINVQDLFIHIASKISNQILNAYFLNYIALSIRLLFVLFYSTPPILLLPAGEWFCRNCIDINKVRII